MQNRSKSYSYKRLVFSPREVSRSNTELNTLSHTFYIPNVVKHTKSQSESDYEPYDCSSDGRYSSSSDKLKYAYLWQRSFRKIKGAIHLFLLCKELRLYGTSSGVVDQSKHYRRNLEALVKNLKTRKASITEGGMPKFVIHPQGNFKRIWNIIVILLLLYTATITPYRNAFIESKAFDDWFYLEIVIDVLFMVDVIINLLTAHERFDGSFETSHKKMFVIYMKSWLLFDVVASIPFTIVEYFLETDDSNQSSNNFNLLRLLRLPRLYRLIRIARIFKIVKQGLNGELIDRLQDAFQLNRGVMRIIKFAATVLVCVHIVGCLWFFLAKLQGFPPDSWVIKYNLLDENHPTQYIASIYWAFTTLSTVGYGDITGGTDEERLFSIVWMLLGVGFYSFAIGSLTSVLSTLDTRSNELTIKLNAVDQISKEARLDPGLIRKLRQAIKIHSHKTELDTGDKQLMFDSLPKKLRYQVAMNMYESACSRIPFFENRSPEFISTIIPHLRYTFFEKDDYVYQEGDDPDEIYFISRGRVNFVVCLQDIRFKSILEGSYFGDVEMFLSSKRLCTCKIVYQTELLVMSKPVISIQMMKYITEEFPEISNEMMELALKRRSKILEAKEEMEKVLMNVDRYAFTRARERKMSTVVMRVPPSFFKKESQSQGSSGQVLPMDF